MANRVDAQSVGRMVDVTKSDTTRFNATIGLTVAGSGDVNVLCVKDSAPHVFYAQAGVFYPIRAIAVYSTSTDATGIVALYEE